LKKLFLTSYFAGTAQLFEQYFVSAEFEKKLVFIPTAANVDEYKKHLVKAQNKFAELGFAVEILDVATVSEAMAREHTYCALASFVRLYVVYSNLLG